MTALAWVGTSLRAFPQHHLRDALRYLELSDEELSRALELLPRLREEIHAAEAPPAS